MARVLFENVNKVYGGNVHATKNVSFEVLDKEFIVLVGPSGCGKSTLLRMVAGLEEITSGKIAIGSRVVNDIPPKDRDIAMVFQNYALYPHMTVYKNMAFGLKLRKFKKDEIDKRVRQAAQILGIEELLDRKPKALSGGQRQRVALGRAIVRQPQVFLFDEPLSNLDAKLRVQMRTEISKLHSRLESTMIYVTHDQIEAMTMGDRIVVLLDGIIQQIADPLTLYDKPANQFVAGFIGSPPMNFISGELQGEGDDLFFNEGSFRLQLRGPIKEAIENHGEKAVVFGVRPEHISDQRSATSIEGGEPANATVEVVEPMGSETYLYLTTGKSNFVARMDGHLPVETDQQVDLLMEMPKTHFFDGKTGKTIY